MAEMTNKPTLEVHLHIVNRMILNHGDVVEEFSFLGAYQTRCEAELAMLDDVRQYCDDVDIIDSKDVVATVDDSSTACIDTKIVVKRRHEDEEDEDITFYDEFVYREYTRTIEVDLTEFVVNTLVHIGPKEEQPLGDYILHFDPNHRESPIEELMRKPAVVGYAPLYEDGSGHIEDLEIEDADPQLEELHMLEEYAERLGDIKKLKQRRATAEVVEDPRQIAEYLEGLGDNNRRALADDVVATAEVDTLEELHKIEEHLERAGDIAKRLREQFESEWLRDGVEGD